MFDVSALTPESISSLDLERRLDGVAARECHAYAMALTKALDEENDEAIKSTLRFVVQVLSMAFRPWSPNEPFGALWEIDDHRSMIPTDLPKEWLKSLTPWALALNDAELRSRFLDVIWLQARDFKAAQAAIGAYVEAAGQLGDAEVSDVLVAQRYERALRLATSLGRGALAERAQVLQAVDALLLSPVPPHQHVLWKLVPFLLDSGHGEPASYAAVAEGLAARHHKEGKFWIAKDLHELAARCYQAANDEVNRESQNRLAAESLVSEAEAAHQQGRGAAAASSILSQAVNMLRQAGGGRDRIDALHSRVLELQKSSVDELQGFRVEQDASQHVQRALAAIDGKPMRDAIITFALMSKPPLVTDLISAVHERAKKEVLGSLAPMDIINARGQVVAKLPALEPASTNIEDAGLRGRVFRLAGERRSMLVQVVINPVRRRVVELHAPTPQDLLALVSASPWVPSDHTSTVVRALIAGFYLDMEVAATLVPIQIEALVRHVVKAQGGATTMLDAERIQQEKPLGPLLEMPEAVKAFGQAGILEMQDLLTEAIGSNLRNEASHGLLTDEGCYSTQPLYAWWLLLRYALLPGLLP
ncbi:DUF4209 domain-containing protein [Rhizobacter sp. J219]|jgi:hypothetical protein|uniref:DUF4209 domain-containing protein n=1 Tax=Piscinibacter gummiphilus TaxID=946333 RepID=A0ABZ0CLK1_9BURK|nr:MULTISPECIES: DUF4209 domain-containing protein [Burkholderiales]MCR5882142.1 DUF4209 domain-containing protein [Rhizobacter sp. J219]WOB05872.1 DUF4209 domain-containing protein [Piscinibacter gummiphilus]